ncbi:MAG TPA: reverse transcriptase/maturase family protein [Candidatus Nanoarchaeia archaeon]
MKVFRHNYDKVISLEALLQAWDEFKKGKRGKPDVGYFEKHLEDNLFQLNRELRNKTYRHSPYTGFYIHDPKVRHIHKATVRDRVVHHALFNVFNPIFEPTFIADSYSCRIGYGTHKGFNKLVQYSRKVSRNYTKDCWALKCDVRKFFDSVDHKVLLGLIETKIKDPDTMWLIKKIVSSYETAPGQGIPIGNLTSQLFANVYLNGLDQFIKHRLKAKYYLRYADDFIILHEDFRYLTKAVEEIRGFIRNELKLELHKDKVFFRRLTWGIDFVGYVALPNHQIVRTKTKRRIYRKVNESVVVYKRGKLELKSLNQSIQSYLGILKHANTHKLETDLRNQIWFWLGS